MRKILMTTALGLTLSINAWASNQDEKDIKDSALARYNASKQFDEKTIRLTLDDLKQQIEVEEQKNANLLLLKNKVSVLQLLTPKESTKDSDTALNNGLPKILKTLRDTKIVNLDLVGTYGYIPNYGHQTRSLNNIGQDQNIPLVPLIFYLVNKEGEFDMGQKNGYLTHVISIYDVQKTQNVQEDIGGYLVSNILKALNSKLYMDTQSLYQLGKELNIFMKATCIQYEELRSRVSTLKILLEQETRLDLFLESRRDKDFKLDIKDEKMMQLEFKVTPETSLRHQILERTEAAFEELKPIYELVLEVIELIKRSGKVC